jgi:hypothetical protein
MPEPLNGVIEPVGASPIGDSGMSLGPNPQPTEPINSDVEEPSDQENENYEDVDFMDLKSVPKPLQKAAKKLQSSFTKAMQVAKHVSADDPQRNIPEPSKPVDPSLDEAKTNVIAYMRTPEGAALKSVFDEMISEKVGDLPERFQAQERAKAVETVISKYGEDVIEANYEQIEEAALKNPNIPLDMVVATVLYDKAKELGVQEFKAKLQAKQEFSNPLRQTPSNSVSNKEATSFGEAFELARKTHGF